MRNAARRSGAAPLLALAVAGIALFAAFLWLGLYIQTHGEPPALWAFAQAARGRAVGLAWAFTNCGFAIVLAPLYLLCIIVGIVLPGWRMRSFYTVICALLSWIAGDRAQHFFHRPRRDDWIVQHVHAFSYPSTHASISASFYLVWGFLLLRSRLPDWVRYAGCTALTLLTLAIIWSRLSLGAHFPTDVIGGLCLGLAVDVLAALAVRAGGARLSER